MKKLLDTIIGKRKSQNLEQGEEGPTKGDTYAMFPAQTQVGNINVDHMTNYQFDLNNITREYHPTLTK